MICARQRRLLLYVPTHNASLAASLTPIEGDLQIGFLHSIIISYTATCCLAYDEQWSKEQRLSDGYDYSAAISSEKSFLDYLRADNRAGVCLKPGLVCKDCKTLVSCVETAPGVIEEHGESPCLANETCKSAECQSEPNPPCGPEAKLTFVCNNIGMFPNQFDCKSLHMCAMGSDGKFVMYKYQCAANYSYNPLTTYCDIKLQDDGTCYAPDRVPEWPLPPCEKAGHMGPITENPTIYFICELYQGTQVLYPYLYLCPKGGTFDEVAMACKEKEPPAAGVTPEELENIRNRRFM